MLNCHYGEVKMTASLWQERWHRLSGVTLMWTSLKPQGWSRFVRCLPGTNWIKLTFST